MALVKNNIPVPFATGLQTKTDDQQLNFTGFQSLENVLFDSPLKLIKRTGYDSVRLQEVDGSDVTGAMFLASFKKELGLFTDTDYYAYSESTDRWSSKGKVFTAFPSSRTIVRNSLQQKNISLTTAENLSAFAYEDSTGIRISVIDNSNNSTILGNELVSASGTLPKIVSIQNTLFVLYVVGTDIRYRTINLLFPDQFEAEQTIVNNIDSTDTKYDASQNDQQISIAYQSSVSGGTLSLVNLAFDGSVSSVIGLSGESGEDGISTYIDPNFRIVVTYSDGSNCKIVIYSFSLTSQLLAPTTIESISDVSNSTAIETSAGNYQVFYEVTATSASDHFIKKNTVTISGTVGTAEVIKRSVGLTSSAFRYDNTSYIAATHDSQFQSTYFILNEDGDIVSKISPNVAGGVITENGIPKTSQLSDDTFLVASQIKGRIISEEDVFFTTLGVNKTEIDFSIEDPFQNKEAGDNLHIAGGIMKMYDGKEIVEHGFHLFPEGITTTDSSTGGTLSDGQYQYSAVYKWIDNKGFIHQSAPSIPTTVTLSGGTSTQQVELTIPTLRLTQKENVVIDVYRTEAAGTVFYKLTSTLSPLENDPTIDSVTFTDDTITDASLIDNELLYTTGGVLDNIAAPASSIIESFSSRIFLAGLENGNTLQFSKIRFDGFPIEFNDTLNIQVNSKGGNITALQAMDEKLIIFKESAIFYMSGDGPNNLGQQDTFTSPELVSSDIGCIDVNSVVLTPLGTMFKSDKGIYLVSRNMSLTYIGSAVERFNDLTITSAVVIPEENQVRFTTENSDALVFNYNTSTWASFSNHQALSAVTIGRNYFYLRDSDTLFKQNENKFTDNGSGINTRIETGWISFSGVQGFQRVYKLLFLGEFKSPHKVKVEVAYDFNDAYTQSVVLDTADFTSNVRYGGNSPYGSGSPYGGDGNVYQFRVDLKRQKCQSIRIRLTEIQPDNDTVGEGMSISNMMFQVGAKQGTAKLADTRTYGTS